MSSDVQLVTKALLQALDFRMRKRVLRRIQAMEQEFSFMISRDDERVVFLRSRGWFDDRVRVFFVLNSVYQQVLGPLQAVSRGGPQGLGTEISVTHGKLKFDKFLAQNFTAAIRSFKAVVIELAFHEGWLYANTCGDLIFLIVRYERDKSEG